MKSAILLALTTAFACLSGTASAAAPTCVHGFWPVKTSDLRSAPPRMDDQGYVCISTKKPWSRVKRNRLCPVGYDRKPASVVKNRRLLKRNTVRSQAGEHTCIAYANPKHLFWNPDDPRVTAPPKMRKILNAKLKGTRRNPRGATVSSVHACKRACMVGDVCRGFTYRFKTKKCFLYTEITGVQSGKGFRSGARTQRGRPFLRIKDSRTGKVSVAKGRFDFSTRALYAPKRVVPTGLIRRMPKVKDSMECANICTATSRFKKRCRVYRFDSRGCRLYRSMNEEKKAGRVLVSARHHANFDGGVDVSKIKRSPKKVQGPKRIESPRQPGRPDLRRRR